MVHSRKHNPVQMEYFEEAIRRLLHHPKHTARKYALLSSVKTAIWLRESDPCYSDKVSISHILVAIFNRIVVRSDHKHFKIITAAKIAKLEL